MKTIKDYVLMRLSDVPDKNGNVYPVGMELNIPEEVNVYHGGLEQEYIVGKCVNIQKAKYQVRGSLLIDTKKVNIKHMANLSACSALRPIELIESDYGQEIVNGELVKIFLSERPSMRDIKKLIEK